MLSKVVILSILHDVIRALMTSWVFTFILQPMLIKVVIRWVAITCLQLLCQCTTSHLFTNYDATYYSYDAILTFILQPILSSHPVYGHHLITTLIPLHVLFMIN